MTGVRRAPLSWLHHWQGFLLAMVLLLWADLATTMAAADIYGLGAEANPIMRWLLGHDLAVVLGVHLLIFVLAVIGFAGIVRIGRSLEGRLADWYRVGCAVWIAGMIVVGFVVVLNNLALTLVPLIV